VCHAAHPKGSAPRAHGRRGFLTMDSIVIS
jgi:hypothetical protein